MQEAFTLNTLIEAKKKLEAEVGPPAEVWITPSILKPYMAEINSPLGKVILISTTSFATLQLDGGMSYEMYSRSTLLGMSIRWLP